MKTVPERVSALRAVMAAHGVDTYIVLSSDPHQSEYVAQYWRGRAYISGFTGSAGTVVITADKAACWVDGRYFLQGEKQLEGTGIALMKMGEPGVPTWQQYVLENTKEKGVVGMDGRTIGNFQANMLKRELAKKNLSFACKEDLLNEVWDDRPALPQDPIFDLDMAFAGESRAEKLARLRAHMAEKKADLYLIASLESSAWLLNYRGADIYATPVAYAFTLVGKESCDLFIEPEKVTPEMKELLAKDGVTVRPYDALTTYWKTLPKSRIAMDLKLINEMLIENLPMILDAALQLIEGLVQGILEALPVLIEKAADCGVLTHGIAAKPGKPTITGFDKESRTMFIGLPGHPAAALMVYEQILIRIWRGLTGQQEERTVRAKITVNVQSAPGRRTFQLVTLQETDDTLAIPLFAKSGMISPMTRADGYFEMSENQEGVSAGDLVHVHLWK